MPALASHADQQLRPVVQQQRRHTAPACRQADFGCAACIADGKSRQQDTEQTEQDLAQPVGLGHIPPQTPGDNGPQGRQKDRGDAKNGQHPIGQKGPGLAEPVMRRACGIRIESIVGRRIAQQRNGIDGGEQGQQSGTDQPRRARNAGAHQHLPFGLFRLSRPARHLSVPLLKPLFCASGRVRVKHRGNCTRW